VSYCWYFAHDFVFIEILSRISQLKIDLAFENVVIFTPNYCEHL